MFPIDELSRNGLKGKACRHRPDPRRGESRRKALSSPQFRMVTRFTARAGLSGIGHPSFEIRATNLWRLTSRHSRAGGNPAFVVAGRT
jgi:hypothetical protein